MVNQIYLIAREFAENKGSYAGFIQEFAKYVFSQGYKVTILCCQIKNQPKFEKLPYADVYRFTIPKVRIPMLGMNLDYLTLALHVRRYFKKNPPSSEDVIIANSRAALGVSNHRYVLRMGQPAFTFLKNMEIAKDEVSILTRIARAVHFSIQYFLERVCVKNALAFICSSHESFTLFTNYYGGKNKPYFVPHSGVKVSDLQNGKKILIEGKKLLFVSAGKERIRKGVIYLERVLSELFKEFRDLKLIHIGEKFPWNVPDWCKERIISVGRVPWSEMKNYYATADIVVFCSLNEWIPNALFEAMASGLPIVTSDIEGIHECLTHLKEGYIYRRGDIKGLKEGIEFMLKNQKARQEMAKNARLKAQNFRYTEYSKKLLKFIEDINSNKFVKSVNLFKD